MASAESVSRRDFVQAASVAGVAGLATVSTGLAAGAPATTTQEPVAALAQLLEGNKRYMRGELAHPRRKPEDFAVLAEGQVPIAVIIGCADARVAPELLFDQGVGDLFVVRVAGNVISGGGASVKGSIEYAVAELGVRLVIVLGHTQCGAVKSAIKHINADDKLPGSINDLVDTIKPAVASVKGKVGDLLELSIRANVDRGVERLKNLEPIIASGVKSGKVKVVGAVYDLQSGKVTVQS
jgi:carbonic anhydrase